MWAVRALLIALVIVLIVAFLSYNVGSDQRVEIDLIWTTYTGVALIEVLFWSFAGGLLISLLLFVGVYVRQAMEIRSGRRKIRALESEVTVLRNRPIEESTDLIEGIDGAKETARSMFVQDGGK
ncbi:MAG: LapA family protein [Candidatus Zixiibacteriota bacterium]